MNSSSQTRRRRQHREYQVSVQVCVVMIDYVERGKQRLEHC